jgi:hypothetical protein
MTIDRLYDDNDNDGRLTKWKVDTIRYYICIHMYAAITESRVQTDSTTCTRVWTWSLWYCVLHGKSECFSCTYRALFKSTPQSTPCRPFLFNLGDSTRGSPSCIRVER